MAQRKSATRNRKGGRSLSGSKRGINSRGSRRSIGFPPRNRSEAYGRSRKTGRND